jgi:isoleucyl-tRNA synthetase
MSESNNIYPKTLANPDFPKLEEKIIAFWQQDNTFKKSVRGDKQFNFYDGPPFANGLPHYGHLLTGYIKDIYARFQTQLGKKVERRFGWDCHGLPAEMGAEKELGISGKVAIENYGINKFNEFCRTSVLKYTEEWEFYVNRQARWVDFKNDYKTMDISYMESVLWAFKELHKKGLIYESYRVMPYSWACETPVSDFETRMDNSYREKVSKTLTVKFKLTKPIANHNQDSFLLVWTTTPWTLPSNLAVAVGSDVEYSLVEKDNQILVIASALMHKYEHELGSHVLSTIKGSELVGLSYQPLFDYFKDHANSFKVFAGDFVTTEDGTGIVHIAPGFGEDDQNLCKVNNIETVCPVDSAGKFTYPIVDWEGVQVFEANDPIAKNLKDRGFLVKTEQYIHNYPHCWRTDTPLIYRALPSWYVKVTDIKDKMIANNQKINWIPNHIKDGIFGKWLENARDWSISRNRYWGCPIPIWKSDNPEYPNVEVYGSIKELEEAFGVKVESLHRPFIDTLVRTNQKDPTGKSMMRRVSDVLDCWFESGSMPYAQVHYPFENTDWFEKNFPADFIVEYLAQTRGWFYTLLVLSTALFDKPPFLNCECHGVLLGNDGQKLSKRLKNYPDPIGVFNELGSDALRWFMASSPVIRGQELVMDKDAKGIKDALRLAIKPIWNAYNFFTLYANADGIEAKFDLSSTYVLDRYILSKCFAVIADVKKGLEIYDSIAACRALESFFETLNNWYIRRSRERFWKTDRDQDKISAYNTLYSVLITICKASAPLMPLTLEEIYLGLTRSRNSVHLEMFPEFEYKVDYGLIKQMERVRDACTAALSLRNNAAIRVRQPLQKVTFIGVSNDSFDEGLKQLVLDEINVKEWVNLDESRINEFANYKLQINFPILGKRLPNKVKDIIAAQKQNLWKLSDTVVEIAGEMLLEGEYTILVEPKSDFINSIAPLASNDSLVLLDINVTEELKLEGVARDIVRGIQQARKDANLDITDKIEVSIDQNDLIIKSAVSKWQQYITSQTLALKISDLSTTKFVVEKEIEVDDVPVKLTFNKV